MFKVRQQIGGAALLATLAFAALPAPAASLNTGWQTVDGIELFHREGGAKDAPTLEAPDDVIRLTVAFLRRHAQGPASGS